MTTIHPRRGSLLWGCFFCGLQSNDSCLMGCMTYNKVTCISTGKTPFLQVTIVSVQKPIAFCEKTIEILQKPPAFCTITIEIFQKPGAFCTITIEIR